MGLVHTLTLRPVSGDGNIEDPDVSSSEQSRDELVRVLVELVALRAT